MIPMDSAQRAAYLAWYADFRNPSRPRLAKFLEQIGVSR